MIIWRGWGILVLVVVVFFELIANSLVVKPLGIPDHSIYEDIVGYLFFLPSAVVIWFLGKHLNGKKQRVVIDKETGQEITLPVEHTFFFVRMEYWAYILPLLTIILCIVRLVGE